uniref:Molybdopterin molybdenumtransferase MoeA n=1 Tax=Staphylothermus marinus TaxID=2280 RepID=A0A7C4HDM0_STAMA
MGRSLCVSLEMIGLDEAIEKAVSYAKIGRLTVVEKSIYDACGLIVAEDYYASIDNPPCDKSYVDGFAIIAEDTYGASPFNPVMLKIIGWMKPNDDSSKFILSRGEAVWVSTGSALPRNSNAVVMYEDVSLYNDYIAVTKPINIWSNVAKRGEDYRCGEILVKKGSMLKPWDLALLASSGYGYVKVYEKIRIGILCTGSELVEPGRNLDKGMYYNSTCVLIKNYLDQIPFVETMYYGIAPDDEKILMDKITAIIGENHMAIVSGGAGYSEVDVTKRVLENMGKWVFKNIAIRPGKPTGLALVNGKPVYSLSGFPVAAWVALEALISPYLYIVMGLKPPVKPSVKAIMKRKVPNTVGYRSFVRVKLFEENGKLLCEPYLIKGSGILSSLVKSDGYVIVSENSEGVDEGEEVNVILK